MKLTFNERKALVTGAGRGIGKAIAHSLADEGVHVICVSKSNNCDAVAKEIQDKGGKASSLSVDVSNANAVKEACENLLQEHERIDILVNNAGITRDGLMLRMSVEDWESVITTNLSSAFYWIRHLLQPMTRGRWGRILNISSVTGIMGNPGQANYGAAKAGMIGLTKCLAKEVGSRNITVNAVAPGFTSTDMTDELDEKYREEIQKMLPIKRFGSPDEVAKLVTYLASEEAGYITGKAISIDGGLVM